VDRRLSGSPGGADNFGPTVTLYFPTEIFISVHHHHHHFYAIRNSISSVRSFILVLSGFFNVTFATEFFFGGPDCLIIRTTPPPYSPDARGITVYA